MVENTSKLNPHRFKKEEVRGRGVRCVDPNAISKNAFKNAKKKVSKCWLLLDREEVPAVIECDASAQLELDDVAEAAVMNMEVIISQ